MKINKEHLPTKCYSSRSLVPSGAVIHYISARYTNPENPFDRSSIMDILEEYRLSYHYYISPQGEIYEWTPPEKQAWHAGASSMNGRTGCNSFAYGIGLGGMVDLAFPSRQIIACGWLLSYLMNQDGFSADWVQGHDEVRAAWNDDNPTDKAPVKVDPGPLFPWNSLKQMIEGAAPP